MTEPLNLQCECDSLSCWERIAFEVDEAFALRQKYPSPRHAVILPGHEAPGDVAVDEGTTSLGVRYLVVAVSA